MNQESFIWGAKAGAVYQSTATVLAAVLALTAAYIAARISSSVEKEKNRRRFQVYTSIISHHLNDVVSAINSNISELLKKEMDQDYPQMIFLYKIKSLICLQTKIGF